MNRRFTILTLLVCWSFSLMVSAQIQPRPDSTPRYAERKAVSKVDADAKVIVMDKAGELAAKLGAEANEIENLKVSGPIDDNDFNTLWSASFYGKLSILNLKDAIVQSGKVPANAFFHPDVQLAETSVNHIALQRIALPEGITEIGNEAFKCIPSLFVEGFPSSLRKLGDACFQSCFDLQTNANTFGLNKGLEYIGASCFEGCFIGMLDLPETLKTIGDKAFFGCKLYKVYLHQGVEEIGAFAFSIMDEIDTMPLPESLKKIGEGNLEWSRKLSTIVYPSSLEVIEAGSYGDWSGIDKICCKAKLPPLCERDSKDADLTPFGIYGKDVDWAASPDTPLYVPVGSADLYRNAWGWNYFSNIIETDDFTTAIDATGVDADNADAPVYDLTGRRVLRPVPGQIYISDGKKYVSPKQ